MLVRAVEPTGGIVARTDGPGRVAWTMGIDRAMSGARLDRAPLWIARGSSVASSAVARTARIGVNYAVPWAGQPFRIFLRGNTFVSRRTART